MAGKAARAKGHGFERYVAKDIRCIFGDPKSEELHKIIKRGLQSRNNQDKVEDVIAPIFSLECKAYKKNPPIKKAFRQAKETADLYNKIPVAVIKEDHKPPYVVLDYEDFIGILHCLVNANADVSNLQSINFTELSEKVVKNIRDGTNSVSVRRGL